MKLASLLLIGLLGLNNTFCQEYVVCTEKCVSDQSKYEPLLLAKYKERFTQYKEDVNLIVEKNWTNSDNASRSSTIEGHIDDLNDEFISEITDEDDKKKIKDALQNVILNCIRPGSPCYSLPHE
ncbi:unnamed protein product [Cunninghamella blakesleeana]